MSESDIWDYVEVIRQLFSYLPQRDQRRLQESRLLRICDMAQELLTDPSALSQAQAEELAIATLKLYRIAFSLRTLYGPIDADIQRHPIFKEIPPLFSKSGVTLSTTDFNIHTAALLQHRTRGQSELLPESTSPGVKMADLRVPGVCYVECKDLQSVTGDHLFSNIRDKASDACGQLRSAQTQARLPFTIACIDVPLELGLSDEYIFEHARGGIVEALTDCTAVNFVILSLTGYRAIGDFRGVEVHWRLIYLPASDLHDVRSASDYLRSVFPSFYVLRDNTLRAGMWPSRRRWPWRYLGCGESSQD